MGARDYVTQRSSQIDQGKDDVLDAIEGIQETQGIILSLRQKAQVERLREPDDALATAMEQNVVDLAKLEQAFNAVANAVEALPASFAQVDASEKRLEAALPSTSPPGPPGPPSSS